MAAINWFEIPVDDMQRAVPFYEALVGYPLKLEDFLDVPHAVFQSSKAGAGPGGALIRQQGVAAASAGTRVYLHTADIDASLERALKIGGKLAQPKTSLGPMGEFALLHDTEGNLVGLHKP